MCNSFDLKLLESIYIHKNVNINIFYNIFYNINIFYILEYKYIL